MNLRHGIDTPPPKHLILVKLNLPFDAQQKCIDVLKDIERVRREAVDPDRMHEGRSVVDGWALNMLVAFGLRFFLGPLKDRGKEEVIQNFPPGGVFTPREPTRFKLKRRVPIYLRTMNAASDNVFVGRRLGESLGRKPRDEEVAEAYQQWLSDNESDLILYIEGNNHGLCVDLLDRLQNQVVEDHGLVLAQPIDESWGTEDGRDLIGWHDPISNLDDAIESNPQYYRSKIYLPYPAPMYPGEPIENRDELTYNGGSYMVHRKYREHLDRWTSEDFSIKDYRGCVFKGEEARNRAVGRERKSGRVIAGSDGRLLDKEPDSADANMAILDSHILQARGGHSAPFSGPFPPVPKGKVHAFHIQDQRIRRRGGNWRKIDPDTGKTTYGLHFVCFQNNIQQNGFEFINNIWLLNPNFRLGTDFLLDPDKGIGEPIGGCYYFVPPSHREYPGEVFFE